MTPYELRFEIFKQAQKLLEYEFEQKIHDYNLNLDRYLEDKGEKPDPKDKPTFPTIENILEATNRINRFVSGYHNKPMALTVEQIKTLKNVFRNYPSDYKPVSTYGTMEGIEEQLKDPQEKDGKRFIFYIDNVRPAPEFNTYSFTMSKMEEQI